VSREVANRTTLQPWCRLLVRIDVVFVEFVVHD